MNYLFLDLSSKSSGYCVSNEQGEILKYGCIKSSSTKLEKRILIMKNEITKLINEYHIEKIIAEEIPNVPNTKTYKVLSWLQGVIAVAAYESNSKIIIEFVQSSTWRSHIGIKVGKGIKRAELKQADINYVFNKYGISANDDICDAICLKDYYFLPKKVSYNWTN